MNIVMKFGGTSMANPETVRGCAAIARATEDEGHRVITVVSAMSGVTDSLLELADAAAAGNRAATYAILAELRRRHEEAARDLDTPAIAPILDRLETLINGIIAVGELTARSRDAVVAHGEFLSAPLFAAAVGGTALTGAEAGITTDDNFGEAEPLMRLSTHQVQENLTERMQRERLVVTGFNAATQHGVVTTIGRGGSDYTATILGAGVKADEIWIYSDVDGLMTADPRIVPDARLLDAIRFNEALEMGQFGAKSMHPRALEPAAEYGIPVRMRGTFNPTCPGTLISADAPPGGVARSVLMLKNTALITVSGATMVGRPGTAAAIFGALAEEAVNVQMISQTVSEATITFAVATSQLDRARAVLERRLLKAGRVHDITTDDNTAIVAIVGCGMRGTPGVAGRVFSAVAEAGINVEAIAQGSSELSICFVTEAGRARDAVKALHDAFGLGK